MTTAKKILEDAISKLDDRVVASNDATVSSDVWWAAWSTAMANISKHSNSVAMVLADEDELPLELASRLSTAIDMLKAAKTLPLSTGPCLLKEVTSVIEEIGEAVTDFLASAVASLEGSVPKSQMRQKAGILWDRCENAEKVARSDEQAFVAIVKKQHMLVADALRELEEDVEASRTSEDDDHDYDEEDVPSWTREECLIVAPGVGLLKVVGNLLKKLSASISDSGETNTEHNEALHLLAEEVRKLSPLVDDFVLFLYSPIKMTDLIGSTEALRAQVAATVEATQACNVKDSTEQSWRKFLLSAAEHNALKLTKAKQ